MFTISKLKQSLNFSVHHFNVKIKENAKALKGKKDNNSMDKCRLSDFIADSRFEEETVWNISVPSRLLELAFQDKSTNANDDKQYVFWPRCL